jgi:hypothetical protein
VNRARAAAASLVFVVACGLSACGGSDDTSDQADKSPSPSPTSASPSVEEETTTGPTIPEYLEEVGATETSLTQEASDGVTVGLPVPAGWVVSEDYADAAPFGAVVYEAAADPADPPRVLAILSRIDGDVDPAAILEYAPNELRNLDGFEEFEPPSSAMLSGFEAVEYGGTYTDGGRTLLFAQKTVVLPGDGVLYVLQLNAYAPEDELDILVAAMDEIDTSTTIE